MRLIGLTAGLMLLLAGCAGFDTHSDWRDERGYSLNWTSTQRILETALTWTIRQYPPGYGTSLGDNPNALVAVSLPEGVSPTVYRRIATRASDRSVPATPETIELPTYIVGDMRIRGSRAEVDIFRPYPVDGESWAHEPITVRLEGGLQPWRVTGARVWREGTLTVPGVHFLIEPEDGSGDGAMTPDEYEDSAPTSGGEADGD